MWEETEYVVKLAIIVSEADYLLVLKLKQTFQDIYQAFFIFKLRNIDFLTLFKPLYDDLQVHSIFEDGYLMLMLSLS